MYNLYRFILSSIFLIIVSVASYNSPTLESGSLTHQVVTHPAVSRQDITKVTVETIQAVKPQSDKPLVYSHHVSQTETVDSFDIQDTLHLIK